VRVKASKYAVFLIVFGTSIFWSPQASAATAYADVTCAKQDGTQQTYQIGWDNSNQFFEGKGYIPRLFCEGGYAPPGFNVYVSDNLPDSATGYYNGVVPTPIVSPSPEPSAAPSTSPSPEPTPSPSVQPSETPTPTSSQSPSEETVTTVTPSPSPEPTPELSPSPSDTPTQVVETLTTTNETNTVVSEPIVPEAPVVAPEVPSTPPAVQPEPAPQPVEQPQPAPEPVDENPQPPVEEEPPVVEEEPPALEPEPVVELEPIPVEEVVSEPQPEPELVPEPEPEPVIDIAPEPPVEEPEPPVVATEDSTLEEREAIAEAIIEAAQGEPVTAQTIADAGLTYADLPPETPVEVRQDENGNEVVITAEVAAALVILADPAALVEAIFTDPAQALLAIASIGADMSDEERAESEKIIVASVIAGQAAVTAAGAAGAAAYRRKP
jgi:hypothetical protein